MKRMLVAVLLLFTVPALSASTLGQTRRVEERVKDPVCGLDVKKNRELSATYRGETYYFCSKADTEKFRNNPEKYVRRD